jgi:hypothetical protein
VFLQCFRCRPLFSCEAREETQKKHWGESGFVRLRGTQASFVRTIQMSERRPQQALLRPACRAASDGRQRVAPSGPTPGGSACSSVWREQCSRVSSVFPLWPAFLLRSHRRNTEETLGRKRIRSAARHPSVVCEDNPDERTAPTAGPPTPRDAASHRRQSVAPSADTSVPVNVPNPGRQQCSRVSFGVSAVAVLFSCRGVP